MTKFHLPHDLQWKTNCTLTLRAVSSTSDKGQTDSHTAQVHTAQPAAGRPDLLVHFSAVQTQSLDTHPQHNFSCSLTCNKCFYRSMTLYYITCLVLNNICMRDILSCKPHHQSLDSATCLENTSCRPYLVQTEIQKPDSFKNKTRGLLWVDVLHIP